ncbi:MAG: tetratricopeptide repeat protein [Bacteroidales bacterium]|jgi:tetratricopeptide (TPR) repeat protein|nr:tetratricopeptide repeat protein [Bacteroidales bacterium]
MSRKTIKLLSIISLLFASSLSFANQDKALLQQANALFRQQSYEESLQMYLTLEPKYADDWRLNYNIGNVYFKLSDLPSAILYYERAIKLNPNDHNTKENLKISNAKLKGESYPLADFFVLTWLKTAAGWCLPVTWSIITIVMLLISCCLFCFYYFVTANKTLPFYCFIAAIILTLASFSLGLIRTNAISSEDYAIVFDANGLINDSEDGGQTYGKQKKIKLYNGQKVEITKKKGDTVFIKTLEGNNTKIESHSIQII